MTKDEARLAVHEGFRGTPVGAPSCAEVPNPLHPATSHSYICEEMTDVVFASVKQATEAQYRRNGGLVAETSRVTSQRDRALALLKKATLPGCHLTRWAEDPAETGLDCANEPTCATHLKRALQAEAGE